MSVFRRFYNSSVDPANKSQWAKFLMDLNLMLDDLVGAANKFDTLPVHANNTDATGAGMKAGQLYRTSTGVLMVVY